MAVQKEEPVVVPSSDTSDSSSLDGDVVLHNVDEKGKLVLQCCWFEE